MGMRLSLRSLFRRGDWRDDVSAYLDDELSQRERQRVGAQLAALPEMREYLADLEQMRSVLRSFDPAPSSMPFQLTAEMVNDPARVPLRPTVAARALRLSMSTAAVGVATFAAVMVFDAVDSPTVTFTTTSAGDISRSIPTAAVVTDEVETQDAAEEEPALVAVVAATSEASEREQAARAEAGQRQGADQAEQAEVAPQAEEQASVAAVDYQQAEQEAEYEGQAQQQALAEQSSNEAASDPSRRALTAGRVGEESDAEAVTAEQVVAQQETEDAAQASGRDNSPDPAENNAATPDQKAESDSTAAESPARDHGGDQQSAEAAAQSETRTVATSVTHTKSDWPLEQRPRSSSVQLATDPSWERPVQIVLAAIAISATVFWLVLTIVDRRRRA